MNYNYNTEKNLQEFIEYLNNKGNEFPDSTCQLLFSDGTHMAYFLRNHEMRIRRWMQSDEAKTYPIAYKKIQDKLDALDKNRETWKALVKMRQELIEVNNEEEKPKCKKKEQE